MMSFKPNRHGLKELQACVQEYLKTIGWKDSEVDEYLGYVEEDMEEKGASPLIKIFSKFDELLNKELPKLVHQNFKFDSRSKDKSPFELRKEELKKMHLPEGAVLDRNTILFDGFHINLIPDPDSFNPDKENSSRNLNRGKSARTLASNDEYMDQAVFKPVKKSNEVLSKRLSKDPEVINDSLVDSN